MQACLSLYRFRQEVPQDGFSSPVTFISNTRESKHKTVVWEEDLDFLKNSKDKSQRNLHSKEEKENTRTLGRSEAARTIIVLKEFEQLSYEKSPGFRSDSQLGPNVFPGQKTTGTGLPGIGG